MTRFNFKQACLLHVSGELGPAASEQLEERLDQSYLAREAHADVKAGFEALRSLPGADLSRSQEHRLASSVKAAIHGALWRRERGTKKYSRWTVACHALGGAVGLAACLGIALGIQTLIQRAEWDRNAAVARAEQSMRDYLNTDSAKSANLTDYAYRRMETDIQLVEDQQRMAMNEVPRNAMIKLLDGLDTPNEGNPDDLEPGAL